MISEYFFKVGGKSFNILASLGQNGVTTMQLQA